MTRRFQVFASIMAVFIIALAGAATYFASGQTFRAQATISRNVATVSLSPVEVSLGLERSATIDLIVDPGQDKLSGVNLKLKFDSEIIKVDSFTEKDLFKGLVQTAFDNETGNLVLSVQTTKTFSGEQTIGSMRIVSRSLGSSTIVTDQEVSPSLLIDGQVRVPIFVGARVDVR